MVALINVHAGVQVSLARERYPYPLSFASDTPHPHRSRKFSTGATPLPPCSRACFFPSTRLFGSTCFAIARDLTLGGSACFERWPTPERASAIERSAAKSRGDKNTPLRNPAKSPKTLSDWSDGPHTLTVDPRGGFGLGPGGPPGGAGRPLRRGRGLSRGRIRPRAGGGSPWRGGRGGRHLQTGEGSQGRGGPFLLPNHMIYFPRSFHIQG